MKLTLSEIAIAVNGKLNKQKYCDIIVNSFGIDSRVTGENQLFIPLKGNKFDGHDFIFDAINRGYIASFSERENSNYDFPVIYVKDCLKALQKLAQYVRNKNKDILIIGVTGSVGKTTTKEYVYNVLNSKYKTSKTIGNYNNHIGLPLSFLNMSDDIEACVLEMGMSNFGEISLLSKIVKPNIAIITNIGVSHIEHLKTRENIFKAKAEIQDGMPDDGIVIINNDNDIIYRLKGKLIKKYITVGIENDSDIRASNIIQTDKGFEFKIDNKTYKITSKSYHDIYNALFAIAVSKLINIKYDLVFQSISKDIKLKHRFEIIENNGIIIIDDSYNASTNSMESALYTVNKMVGNRRIAVLGDMLELGDLTIAEHNKIGDLINKLNYDVVLCVGNYSKYIYERIKDNSKLISKYLSNEEALRFLREYSKPGDVILFKASRGVKLDQMINEFLGGIN
ncbi:UDP-N-acetylmuramoyl-tripeptide--D-alanyl-D-alanine ligase [Caldicellulosiruptoraceae bacterium PP1]